MTSIMRVRARGSGWTGSPGLLTVYWRPGTTGGSAADASDVVARVRACLNSAKVAIHNSGSWLVSGQVDVLEDTTGELTGSFGVAGPALVTGTVAGEVYAASSQLLIQAQTGAVLRGRKVQGRTNIGPLGESSVSAGQPDGVITPNVVAAFVAMLTGGATASFPVVWSRPVKDPTTHAILVNGTSFPITGYTSAAYLAVLRSRRD